MRWDRRVIPFARLIFCPATCEEVGGSLTQASGYTDGALAVSLWRPCRVYGQTQHNAATDPARCVEVSGRSVGRRRTRGGAPRSRRRTAFLPKESWIVPRSVGSIGLHESNPGRDVSIHDRWFDNLPCEL